MTTYYCLCCASFQEPQASGGCCVWCCRNTQEGTPHTTSLLPTQDLSVEGRLVLQTSMSSSLQCEAHTVALLRALSHSRAAVSCICFNPSPALRPQHGQENWADLVSATANGNFLVQRVMRRGCGTELQLKVRPTLKSSLRCGFSFCPVT